MTLCCLTDIWAQLPAVRPIPPPGVSLPEKDAAELAESVQKLGAEIDALKATLQGNAAHLALLPDIQIFHKSADWALRHDEFFDLKQIPIARAHLALGTQRARELREGNPSWTRATGLVVRGYVSQIDGSVQPYGMVIPSDWNASDRTLRRLDFWMHGRAEKLSELDFIEQRLKNTGEFTPEGAFVLHLYGRYCCANKFAGETDLFEALAHAQAQYPVDPAKLVVRGFSMGGASCWQFATHFGSLWAAAAPGAGFAESKEFLRLGQSPEKPLPALWEQTLWRWYDSTVYAGNLAHVPTVAYSGELDGQKQAADIMLRFLKEEGLQIPHVIGPQTAHKYHPDSKPQIEAFLEKATATPTPPPNRVRFTTYSLIYPKMGWVEIESMGRHWERADVEAILQPHGVTATTRNVRSLKLHLAQTGKFANGTKIDLMVDGQSLQAPLKDGFVQAHRDGTNWKQGPVTGPSLRKQPGLCGPIDHAFMSSFIMVRPTGAPLNPTVGAWARSELDHALLFWRKVFRGDAQIKDDIAITSEDIAQSNLILWGDPSSNALLARILPQLPLQWTAQEVTLGNDSFDASRHAPIMIFPNPLNPRKYIVINSGVTFREEALLNNANQIPKLPDWAVLDLQTPPNAVTPGNVLKAGFFNENWTLP
jgi:hypothetical protein